MTKTLGSKQGSSTLLVPSRTVIKVVFRRVGSQDVPHVKTRQLLPIYHYCYVILYRAPPEFYGISSQMHVLDLPSY